MSDVGSVHKLTVHDVGEPYGPLDTSEFADWELEHPPECKRVKRSICGNDPCIDGCEYEVYDCAVQWNIEQAGLRWSLYYSGSEVTEPGEYSIVAWAETIRGFDYVEYDGGIALIR
jgi:hypothetical protein